MPKISRRALLVGTGGLSLALPFLSSWRDESGFGVLNRRASADNTAPQRAVFVVGYWGVHPESWEPKNTNADGTQWEFGDTMKPLESLKSKTLVLTGINHADLYKTIDRNGSHDHGGASLLSSAGVYHPNNDVWIRPNGPTIDFILADNLQPQTKFKRFWTGDGLGHQSDFLVDANKNPVSPDGWYSNPGNCFDLFFRDFQGDGAERQRVRTGRGSVLDSILPAYQRMSARLNGADKQTLDEHVAAIRDLEIRTQGSFSCSVPSLGDGDPWAQGDRYHKWAEVIARALACDLTRSLVFTMNTTGVRTRGHILTEQEFAEINPPNYTEDVHSYGHAGWRNPLDNEIWKRIQIFRMSVFAHLGKTLDSFTEANGKTALDNSFLLYSSEIMAGLHDMMPLQEWGYSNPKDLESPIRPKGIPYVALGSLGGKFKTGIHHDFSKVHRYGDGLGKYGHGELFLTIARAMGIGADKLPTVGIPDVCTRTVDELWA